MRALSLILPLLCRVAWAGDPGCVLTATAENLPPGELQVRGLSAPFGTVKAFEYHHEVTLWLPQGPWSQPTPLLIDTDHVRLAVELLPTREATLYLRKPVGFGVFTAATAQPVRAVTRSGAKLTLQTDAPAIFKPRDTLSVQAPCDVVSLGWVSSFDESETTPGPSVMIAPGREFPITASPSGRVEGTITLVEERDAIVLDRRAELMRVRWSVPEGVFEGWIPSAVTTPTDGGYGRGGGVLRGKQSHDVDVIDDTMTRCLQNVTLSVRLGKELAPLGQLKAGTPFRVQRAEPSGKVIALALDGVSLHPGAELVLAPPAWRDCR